MLLGMDDLTSWRDVGRELAKAGRGARSQLAKRLNMDPSYLARKIDTDVELTLSQIRAVREYFDGEDSSIDKAPTSKLIPVYGYAAATGGDRIAFNPGEILDWVELPMGLNPRGEVFVVKALGSSMEPRIFDGESLVVQRNVPPTREKDAVIEFSDGSAVVKTYRGQRQGHVFAYQYNEMGELKYDATKVKAIHAVLCRL
jgi:phage repressor protein C with HTH and peptisase S24 domain